MTTALSPIIVSHLEKAATDNGFEQELDHAGTRAGLPRGEVP
ncbi:hypothetical protein [Cystobacter fuscus]|nr:hypothetical protein [Cystobacter fuscus]